MHIKQVYVLYFSFSFINAKEKLPTNKSNADNKNKAKGNLLYNHQTNSRMP